VRVWTKSACVVLAWSILVIIVAASGMIRSHPAQANTRTASSTTEIIVASTLSAATASAAATRPDARYVVQLGDTLSGIAAALGVPGGWPTLYTANRHLIGPDPGLIHPGTVLVLPGQAAPARYTVAAGDTLSGIAAALGVPGGWSALYTANRHLIGPDPGLIRPGMVLAIPRPAARSPSAWSPGHRLYPVPPSAPAGSRHRPGAARTPTAGTPGWLKTLLLAAGLLIGAAFLVEPVLAVRRRRAAARVAGPAAARVSARAGMDPAAGSGRQAADQVRIVLADYDRLVVTHSARDRAVYVLRPPGEDPSAILRVARLVLPEGPYHQLAVQLGLPVSWPIVLADYDRLVVTCSVRDGTVCVLRPPGQDPAVVLKAARLVLPEGPYEELADQLGLPASWPLEPR
jgi:LysM repeat protein